MALDREPDRLSIHNWRVMVRPTVTYRREKFHGCDQKAGGVQAYSIRSTLQVTLDDRHFACFLIVSQSHATIGGGVFRAVFFHRVNLEIVVDSGNECSNALASDK